MKSPLLIELFDLYGKEIPLQIFSAPKKKNIFGAIMGVLSLLSIGAITIYFLMGLFSRDTKQIVTSQRPTLIPLNNLTNMPFVFTLLDPLGLFVSPDAGVWSAYAIFFKMGWSNGTLLGINRTFVELRPCLREDAAGQYSDSVLANSLCVPFGKYDFTLNSYKTDITNGWSQLYLYVTKCNPKLKTNCKNTTVINSSFEKASFNVGTMINLVDHDDVTSPGKLVNQVHQITLSTSLFKQLNVYYTQNLYVDDYGFIFESLTTHNFFTLGDAATIYSLGSPNLASLLQGSEVVAEMCIANTQNVSYTKRTFLKAQAVLANIGGIIKFIMVIAQIITQFVVRKFAFVEIGNEVYDYNDIKPVVKRTQIQTNFLEIEGDALNVVPITESKMTNPLEIQKFKLRRNLRTSKRGNENRLSLKLTLYQFLCVPCFISDKNAKRKYDFTERTILEKISIHSIVRDSHKLEELSKLTLNPDQYKKLKETTRFAVRDLI